MSAHDEFRSSGAKTPYGEALDEIDRLRTSLAQSEVECDRLRGAYNDVRALNVQIHATLSAELAAVRETLLAVMNDDHATSLAVATRSAIRTALQSHRRTEEGT